MRYLESLSTFADYPLASVIHWCQGAGAGILLVYGMIRKHPELAHYALVIILLFLVYEALEQQSIGDDGWKDVLNFAVLLHLSAGITAGYYAVRKRISTPAK